MDAFHYHTAFSRNIGWVTPTEQELLRNKRVAIAGMGGVGGSHLLTLTRLGIGSFNLADPDAFELVNFNRQAGANLHTVGQPKVQVLGAMALAINPDLDIRYFPAGIDADNLADFLTDVDLYVDSLDFFAIAIRRQVFAACAEKRIPAITAAPLGMGTAILNFLPGKMTFEEYFRLAGQPEQEQLLRFFLGLAPAGLHMKYLVDPTTIDLQAQRGPSTGLACEMCAGIAASQALKILLRRGKVVAAPNGLQYDAFCNRLRQTWLPGGNQNPLQRAKLAIVRRRLAQAVKQATAAPPPAISAPEPNDAIIYQILDQARWAPSGDNTQPWRFEVIDPQHVVVHGFDTRDRVVYDLEGHASQLSLGALLENIDLAARARGFSCAIQRRVAVPDTQPTFDVRLQADPDLPVDPLEKFIYARVTQRRPLRREPLSERERQGLAEAVGNDYYIVWLEGDKIKRQVVKLLFLNAHIRLTTPEAYTVHRDIIQWDAQYSADRIPDQAIGLDPVAIRLMRWALQSWERVAFMNKYFAGTLMPRVQLDVIPALACAAHFVIVARKSLATIDDYIAGGRAMQRFWLTATQLGLQFQPEVTPIIFAEYTRRNIPFTQTERSLANARKLTQKLQQLIGSEACQHAVYMGRVGFGAAPMARSTRLPLDQLLTTSKR